MSARRVDALSVTCPVCGMARRSPCRSSRQPGAATLGGGWGGPPVMVRPHSDRARLARLVSAQQGQLVTAWERAVSAIVNENIGKGGK